MELKKRLKGIFAGDKIIWGIIALFMIYSLLAVYSSSVGVAFKNFGGNTFHFFKEQLIFLIISVLIIIVVHKFINYKLLYSLGEICLAVAVIILVLTLVFGVSINNATRWLEIPLIKIKIQTSEIAKLLLIIYLVKALAANQNDLKDYGLITRKMLLPVILICVLILPENFSTAAMIFGICLIIMYIGRVPLKFLLSYIGIGIAGISLIILLCIAFPNTSLSKRFDTWKNRIENYFSDDPNPDNDFQPKQAKIAISTGGLFGKAPGKSTQRNMLPQSNSDFIFAIIIEEYGLLLGALPLVLGYITLMFRGILISNRCKAAFPALLATGLTIMIVIQALLNMMVAVGLFPVTGQTLPLVSWGKSSVIIMGISLGIILGISRDNNIRLKKEKLSENDVEVYNGKEILNNIPS